MSWNPINATKVKPVLTMEEALRLSNKRCPRCWCKIQECERACTECDEYLFENED